MGWRGKVISFLFPGSVHRFANLFEKSWHPVCAPLTPSFHLTRHTEQKGGLCPSHAAGHSPRAANSLNTEVQRDGEEHRATGGAAVGPSWPFSLKERPHSLAAFGYFSGLLWLCSGFSFHSTSTSSPSKPVCLKLCHLSVLNRAEES